MKPALYHHAQIFTAPLRKLVFKGKNKIANDLFGRATRAGDRRMTQGQLQRADDDHSGRNIHFENDWRFESCLLVRALPDQFLRVHSANFKPRPAAAVKNQFPKIFRKIVDKVSRK